MKKIGKILLALCFLGCTYTLSIKDGFTAHQQKQYAVAITMLEKEYAKSKLRSERGKIAFLIADSYQQTGQFSRSESWYKIAYDNNFGPEALKGYAFSLKKQEKYSEAREVFKNLGIEIGSAYEYRKEINACNIAADWRAQADGNGWKIEPAPFNSSQNDFSPAYFLEGSLVFSSDRKLAKEGEDYRWTGNKFMDLFVVAAGNASAQNFDNQLNSSSNEGTASFSSDFREVFFCRSVSPSKYEDAFCKIYFAQKNTSDNSWDAPQILPFQKERINYVHPVLMPDGNTLVFSANDPEGWGGYDLYFVQRTTNGGQSVWGEPKPFSRAINTPGNEVFATFDADTLYFSSDGHTGMGGLDIFKTYRLDKNTWAPPQNLKSPINSGADDFGFIVDARSPCKKPHFKPQPGDLLRTGFFTSNRQGGRGGDDIYQFEQRQPLPKPVPTTPEMPSSTSSSTRKMRLEGFVLEKIYAQPNDPNAAVLGRRPLPGAVVQFDLSGKKQKITVGEDGMFAIELMENTDYLFVGSKTDYLTGSVRFSTKNMVAEPAGEQVFEVEIVLDKIFRNKEIVLQNIYYDYDKWNIRPDAEPTLNELVTVLQQNPEIRISLGSHTDCRGNDGYNRQLSQRRAQAAVNYLISKGIAAERLTAVGYGEEQPAVDCICTRCTEADHQANRRTTFRIE